MTILQLMILKMKKKALCPALEEEDDDVAAAVAASDYDDGVGSQEEVVKDITIYKKMNQC